MFLCTGIYATHSFIASSATGGGKASRNELKEQLGDKMHVLLEVSADIESEVGRFLLRMAHIKRTLAQQGRALLNDDAPFDEVSSKKLQHTINQCAQHTRELHALLQKVSIQSDAVVKTLKMKNE